MNYVELQEGARRNTRRLVVLMAAAVTAIVLELFFLLRAGGADASRTLEDDLGLLASVACFTLVFVGGAGLYKAIRLGGGGPAVAEMLGGRAVPATTRVPAERTLRNVVEEMAIASALPVPAVYVLDDEPGMNAFAAGTTPQAAAVAVTRGTLTSLDRDELQGVVAHEFAHIRNGDMRLNTRLIAIQFGIMAIGMTGLFVLLAAAQMRTNKKEGEGIRLALGIAGLVLAAVGWLGFLKARLIQSAVSRQREYLADASAVELTRNPAGLASALRKIGASEAGSRLRSAHAAEVGHLLFGEGRRPALFGLLATHPPIEKRIQRLEAFVTVPRSPQPPPRPVARP